jgi:hypothetical protein
MFLRKSTHIQVFFFLDWAQVCRKIKEFSWCHFSESVSIFRLVNAINFLKTDVLQNCINYVVNTKMNCGEEKTGSRLTLTISDTQEIRFWIRGSFRHHLATIISAVVLDMSFQTPNLHFMASPGRPIQKLFVPICVSWLERSRMSVIWRKKNMIN